ncbi:cytochrome P450 [Numidum massiliense]|uniref:cytochrome P450 n=1 Tax=Numidum massiliense TaxID=1522315 RepID=UPI000AE8AC2C|nr:cytochrome P450 [Numidum massiliense]
MKKLDTLTHVTNSGFNAPYVWYRDMRLANPVWYDEEAGMWRVFKYDDVKRVLSDYDVFSAQKYMLEGVETDHTSPIDASILNLDPPRHRELRSLVSKAFTPRSIAQLAPKIQHITHDLLATVNKRGAMDVVRDLAFPLPVIVIAELIGIPREDLHQFKRWSDAVVEDDETAFIQAEQEMGEYFPRIMAERRLKPREDLISRLVAVEEAGQQLSEREIIGFCELLLVAGNETTTNLIANAMLCFAAYPEAWQALQDNRELLPSAIEEVLRFRSPVKAMSRLTKAPIRLRDRDIPEGAVVVAYIASGNVDEEKFPNADTFDITRSPNQHLGFGHGIHFCLGAPLARLEARIALEALLAQFHTFHSVRETALEMIPSFVVHGVKQLPITFETHA